jgi:hypothetical protein
MSAPAACSRIHGIAETRRIGCWRRIQDGTAHVGLAGEPVSAYDWACRRIKWAHGRSAESEVRNAELTARTSHSALRILTRVDTSSTTANPFRYPQATAVVKTAKAPVTCPEGR